MSYQREFHDRVRVGLVGAGSHAYRNVLPALNFLPVELVAIADPDAAHASAAARQYGAAHYPSLTEMAAAETLDAVLLCVGPHQHPPLALEAFDAGLHVWMEKPVAARSADVQRLIEHRGDRVAVAGFKKTFMPATVKARELLETETGPLRSMLVTYPMVVPDLSRDGLDSAPANSLWLIDGCHPLSFMADIGGSARTVSVHRSARGGGACVVTFDDGVVGTLHLADGAPRSQPFERYALFADACSIEIDNGAKVSYQRGIASEYGRTTSFAPPGQDGGALVWSAQNSLNTLENHPLFVQGLWGSLAHFCDAVLRSVPAVRGTLELGARVVALYEAAMLSDGTPVRVAGAGA